MFRPSFFRSFNKGGFYSEGTDEIVISSTKRTLSFSWAWILNLRCFKGLKLCQIRAWSSSEGSNTKMEPYLSLQSFFRLLCDIIWNLQNLTILKFKLRKIIRFVCFRKWQIHEYLLNKNHLEDQELCNNKIIKSFNFG